jgi:two-component system sensor histidine kinase CpxA
MAERIGKMLTSQRRLLRDLSHELRSPLARLQVALELARKRAGDSASAELQRIELESERLNQMIGQILSLVRLESDPSSLSRAAVDLEELLGSVVEDAEFEARASGKSVTLESNGPLTMQVNDEVLKRAIENIVRNAVRHTAEGTTVDVRLARDGDDGGGASIRVRDRGPGVAESALSHLFEPFYRDAEARGSDPGGFGLGLAIAKRGVEVHGGSVVARNHADGGLEVELRLGT